MVHWVPVPYGTAKGMLIAMILYHGSYLAVEKPDLSFSRQRTDFGRGFYLTPLKMQAESWAQRFFHAQGTGVISAYEFLSKPDEELPTDAKILEFDSHNLEWLNFITACRLGFSHWRRCQRQGV
jgi:hypothetical protein